MFKPKYKIKVELNSFNAEVAWYVAYVKYWWFPLWLPIMGVNYSKTQEQAEKYIQWHKNHTLYINDKKEIK